MIQHTAEIRDITVALGNGLNPVMALPLKNGEVWRARAEPVVSNQPDSPLAWTLVRDGDILRIPMIPYRVARDPAYMLLGMLDVMQRMVQSQPSCCRTHIIVGTPVQDLETEGEDLFRVWLGFAVQIQ
jgi:hypothetical protein